MTSMLRMLLVVSGLLVLGAGCSESHTSDTGDSGPSSGIDSGRPADSDAGPVAIADSGVPTPIDAGGPVLADAGTSEVDGGGTSMDTDAGPPGVTCGTETCVDPQICCVTFGSGGGMPTSMCGAPADCMGVAAACDGPEDCGTGEVCCGMRSPGGGGGTTACTAEAMCGFGRLCHADADCAGMDTCCMIMGASVCTPFCPGGP